MKTPVGIENDRDLPSIVESRWLGRALSTKPANRANAEKGVRLAYGAAGLEPPSAFVWRRSPLEGAIEAQALGEVEEQVSHRLWDRLVDEARDQIRGPAEKQDGFRANLASYASHPLEAQVEAGIQELISRQLREQVQAWLLERVSRERWLDVAVLTYELIDSAMYGQHAASWLAHYDVFASFLDEVPGAFRGVSLVAQSAGWWWPYESTAILTDRPELVRRDERGRLHAGDGPAIRYRDGWGVWAWHGVRVPRRVIEAPRSLTPDEICAEQDPEVQRAMVERYGAAAA